MGDDVDPIELNMSLWHLYTQVIQKKNDIALIGSETALPEDEQDEELTTPQLPKILSSMDLQVPVKLTVPSS